MRTFRIGGVHPADNKLSKAKEIVRLGLPTQVAIPLSQNLGAPSVAVVKKGDTVKVGTLIATPGGFVGSNIHSSVSGVVSKIDEVYDASGYKKSAIVIDVEGDEWEPTIDKSKEIVRITNLMGEEIIKRVTDAGIVGLGGATFPTQVKLTPPPGERAQVLIINAVECEPYLTSDHRLMLEKTEEIIIGTTLLMRAIKVDRAVIGIESNKPDAIASMIELAKGYSGVEVMPLIVMYPQGGEKQLIDAVIRRQVGSGKLPISVGAVVQNVGTAYAVYEAVMKNKPLIERVVTVTGHSLKEPSNFLVRLGTPISMLVEAAGGIPEDTGKVISGGPMMGKALISTDLPMVKGCSGILLLPKEAAKRKEAGPCMRCAKCVTACPMGLEPYLLMQLGENQLLDRLNEEKIMDCIECGCCTFTCPSSRPLLDYIRVSKARVGAMLRAKK